MIRILQCVAVSLACALVATAANPKESENETPMSWVDCQAQAEVSGLVVRLGDVASVKSLDARLKRRISAIEIGRFDRGRDRLVLTRDSLRKLLKEQGIDEKAVILRGAQKIVARPTSAAVSADRIRRMVDRHVRDMLRGEEIVSIRPALPLRAVRVPSGRYHSELRVEADKNNPLYAGRVELQLAVVVDGEVAQRVAVPTIIERRGRIVVAKKRVPKGRTLGFDDLEYREVDLGSQGTGLFRTIDEVVGQITRMPLVGGQPLRLAFLRQAPVIRRGDIVTVRARIGKLEATALCRALADAAPGERFSLRNIDSKKTVYAVAVDSRVANALMTR
jgi:flagellar basal body P-ring formation protein FlgA